MVEKPDPRRRSEIEPGDQTTVNWEEMAAWWDERQGNEGDLWHRTLIGPTLFRVLGCVEGQMCWTLRAATATSLQTINYMVSLVR